jgi:hypothetical protein
MQQWYIIGMLQPGLGQSGCHHAVQFASEWLWEITGFSGDHLLLGASRSATLQSMRVL